MADQERSSSEWPPRIVVFVGTVVLRGERALFVRQARGHSLEGQWSIPWGAVDPEESPDVAALPRHDHFCVVRLIAICLA